jgi:hypothetical protein
MSEILHQRHSILDAPIVDSVNEFKRITYPFKPIYAIGHVAIYVKVDKIDWHIYLRRNKTHIQGKSIHHLDEHLRLWAKEWKKTNP